MSAEVIQLPTPINRGTPGANPNDTFDPALVVWVMDVDKLPDLIEAIRRCSEVVIDLETTGLNEHADGRKPDWPVRATVVLASLTLPDEQHPEEEPVTFVVPLRHPRAPLYGRWRVVLTRIVAAIRDSGKPVTNQNLKFDLRWLFAHTGIDLSGQFAWDTQISSHLLDETASTKLKERAPATFGVRRWDDHDLSTPGAAQQVPLYELGLYAARDTYWTWKLAKRHRTLMGVGAEGEGLDEPEDAEEVELRRLGQLAVWCAMPTSATLTAMEQRGIRLDEQWVRRELGELDAQVEEIWPKLAERYPGMSLDDASFAPTSLWFMSWAEKAVEAGELRIMAYTKGQKPQWSKRVLRRNARTGSPVAQLLLDYRQAAKRAEFLHGWLEVLGVDGRIHATYNAGKVITGRLSAANPNMQQVTGALKPAFVPSEGHLIAELDYSQIELRVAAHIARCVPMIEAYQRGDDLHTLMAARITGKDPAEVTKEERQQAKAGNFGFLYGSSPEGFRDYAEDVYGVILTADEAVMIHRAFFQQWGGMSSWHEKAIRTARQTGQVVSPLGRVRRLPDIRSDNGYLAGHAERQAINSPVQSFASDLMQMAAASIEGYLPGYDRIEEARLVGTVHDSIVIEVPEDDWQRTTARCMRRMMSIDRPLERMGCQLSVPLAVEAKVSTRWGLGDIGVIQ